MKIRGIKKKIRKTTDILHSDFPGRNEIAIEGSPLYATKVIKPMNNPTQKRQEHSPFTVRIPVLEKKAETYSPTISAVPSARVSLTALFGMVRGGASRLYPPEYDT